MTSVQVGGVTDEGSKTREEPLSRLGKRRAAAGTPQMRLPEPRAPLSKGFSAHIGWGERQSPLLEMTRNPHL